MQTKQGLSLGSNAIGIEPAEAFTRTRRLDYYATRRRLRPLSAERSTFISSLGSNPTKPDSEGRIECTIKQFDNLLAR
jgi:hypothetical protein